ncbi:dephospho-CoA kinase [Lacihabitans sp. LS3-19]|uniref:dephospho-CoA kinase n=1 Tax=Lacihabitans sp. LS3-19 TaxID=2487335 RepID=UPI0020CCC8BD|nr:dephospho-CoA kinase [Lacihabitans sp. LS3-19]MCP9770895.1 dephospho-CoA kinase [Lacihabitans sp. LS3-19]
MLKIGLTGGIGSGKSVVAKLFGLLGVPVYESDQRAKWLIENNLKVKNKIIDLLGKESYFENGKYNKVYVAQQVFGNQEKLNLLNAIVHPSVSEDFKEWCEQKTSPYIIKEAAIMNKNSGLDKIIYVESPTELRIQRILERDKNRTFEQVQNIIKNQKSETEFKEIADFIISNNEEAMLIPQVLDLDRILKSIA